MQGTPGALRFSILIRTFEYFNCIELFYPILMSWYLPSCQGNNAMSKKTLKKVCYDQAFPIEGQTVQSAAPTTPLREDRL